MKSTLLFVSIFGIVNLYAQNEQIFYPDKDVSLGYHDNYATENTNYGWAYQFAGYVIDGASGGYNKNRALIHFDLSTIPTNTIIDSAKLFFYHFEDYTTAPLNTGHYGNNECYLKKVMVDWNENTVTWNTQPATTDENMVILEQSISPTQDYTVDVSNLIQHFISFPLENFGLKFGLLDEVIGNNLSFYSRESMDSTKRPKLVVYMSNPTNTIPQEQIENVLIYPNPVTNELNLKCESILEAKLYDSQGNIIKFINSEASHNKIDVSGLQKGNYFIEITSKNGLKSKYKFIKI